MTSMYSTVPLRLSAHRTECLASRCDTAVLADTFEFGLRTPFSPPPPSVLNYFAAVIYMQESLPHKRFLIGCGSPFMRLVEQLTVLRAWGKHFMPGR